jgi:hypothetical protein
MTKQMAIALRLKLAGWMRQPEAASRERRKHE